MKKLFIIFMLFGLSACSEKIVEKDGSGSLRYEVFKECMKLAARLQSPSESLSTTESEVGDVVDECSNEAYYMANHITTKG